LRTARREENLREEEAGSRVINQKPGYERENQVSQRAPKGNLETNRQPAGLGREKIAGGKVVIKERGQTNSQGQRGKKKKQGKESEKPVEGKRRALPTRAGRL